MVTPSTANEPNYEQEGMSTSQTLRYVRDVGSAAVSCQIVAQHQASVEEMLAEVLHESCITPGLSSPLF